MINLLAYYIDPINCNEDPCHLAWLIRDKRNLGFLLRSYKNLNPTCSNGTLLVDLDFKRFNHCPNVISNHQNHSELQIIYSTVYINGITILCQNHSQDRWQMRENAFMSSWNLTHDLTVSQCDITGLNFHFLRGFNHLEELCFTNIVNVDLADWTTLPHLLKLVRLRISNSTGLDKWTTFPDLSNGLIGFDISNNFMGDIAMDRFLNWIRKCPNIINTLKMLYIRGNELTKLPLDISSFKNLEIIDLSNNSFRVIRSGSFVFSNKSNLSSYSQLNLSSCEIQTIEPGAFQGLTVLNIQLNYLPFAIFK